MQKQAFIPIWQFAKEKGTSSQNIYRWIREGKIAKEFYRKRTVCKEKLEINVDTPVRLRSFGTL
jgi:predicted transcriptional regulator